MFQPSKSIEAALINPASITGIWWYHMPEKQDIIYKYIDGEQNLQVLPEPDLNDAA
jgi:hypothetical protein